jgi:hypothetical protein
MQQQITLFRVFIASPSDLADERAALREIVNTINRIFSKETDWRIELLGWEDTMPGGGRPQELINVDVDKADLFIGCLWRRWGTPAGADGKTGFEEEFERALDRWTKTTEPEIWLFFKEVSEEDRKDPGEQLKKVIAFRDREEKARRLLFQQFTDVEDWRQRIAPLLNRQLLRLVRRSLEQKEAQAPQSQHKISATPTALTSGTQPAKTPGVASIVSLLRTVADGLATKSLSEFRDSEGFDDSRCVRLLLFATAIYAQKIASVEFGTHETNSAYWHRAKLKPTGQELLLLIKTVLTDYSVTKPGWYWASRWRAKMSFWLPWLIRFDPDDGTRARAVHFATETAFQLHGAAAGKAIYTALSDASKGVRFAALKYLAKHGPGSALPELRKLSSGTDSDVDQESRNTEHAIRIRLNTDKEVNQILANAIPLSQTVLSAVFDNIERLASSSLERCLNHSSPKLRSAAARELVKRSSLTLPAALQLVTDDSRVVKEQGFYGLINHGAAPTPAEIRYQLSGYRPYVFALSEEFINADEVIRHYFSKQSAEKLWGEISLVDENSAIALRVLGDRFPSQRTAIRDALIDDFEQYVTAAKSRRGERSVLRTYTSLLGEDPIESVRRQLRTAALQALADRPEPADKDLFQRFLSSEISATGQTIACLRGLSFVGANGDTAFLKPFLASSSGSVQAAAARTLLLLAADRSAAIRQLIRAKSQHIIWILVALELKRRDREVWKQLRPLLSDPEDDVRRLISYYAASVLERREISRVLNEYLKGGWYYYNVVTLLDRALYTPPNVRTYYRGQEIEHFARLSSDATHGWPGLSL